MKTDAIAEFLATPDGLALVRSLQGLGLFAGRQRAPAPPSDPKEAKAILEWKPTFHDGRLSFERAEFYRCKPKQILPRSAKSLRICLFGESMAAGFPLAPAYSPAIVLEELLKKAKELEGLGIEMIDLAMPNMGPSEQLRVAEAAQQLSPSVCVFMNGNNWYYGLSVEPTAVAETRVHYAEHLTNGGFASLAAEFRKQLNARAKVMVGTLVESSRNAGALPVIVIPPVNHDWERKNPPPWLRDGKTRSWYEHLEKAERALNAKDYQKAHDLAVAMQGLEDQLSGTPQRIRVRALLGLNRRQEAHDAAMEAIDAVNWQNYSWALPQVPSYVADAMREGAKAFGVPCVDLNKIFAEHTGSSFLDFRMFFDHCHLSVEGLHVAMAAIASAVVQSVAQRTEPWPERLKDVPKLPNLLAASANFQGLHWLSQFYPDIVENDLEQRLINGLQHCLRVDKHFAQVFTDHIRLKSLACSPDLNAALPQASRVPGISSSLSSKRLNAPLLAAMLHCLQARGESESESKSIFAQVIASYQARLRSGIDLSQAQFRDNFWEKTPLAWDDPQERQAFPLYSALWRESRFSFLSDASEDLHLECITRSAAEHQPIDIFLNGTRISQSQGSRDWLRHACTLPAKNLKNGINGIRLLWPLGSFAEDAAWDTIARRFGIGAPADILPEFGSIFSLRVKIEAKR